MERAESPLVVLSCPRCQAQARTPLWRGALTWRCGERRRVVRILDEQRWQELPVLVDRRRG